MKFDKMAIQFLFRTSMKIAFYSIFKAEIEYNRQIFRFCSEMNKT